MIVSNKSTSKINCRSGCEFTSSFKLYGKHMSMVSR